MRENTPLVSTETEKDGTFPCDELSSGSYYIKVTKPNNLNFSPNSFGGETGLIALSSGQRSQNPDFGLFGSATNPATGDSPLRHAWIWLAIAAAAGIAFSSVRVFKKVLNNCIKN